MYTNRALGYELFLAHHGVKGMKWGVRRYQPYGKGGYNPKDGSAHKANGSKNEKIGEYSLSSKSDISKLSPDKKEIITKLSNDIKPEFDKIQKDLDDIYKKLEKVSDLDSDEANDLFNQWDDLDQKDLDLRKKIESTKFGDHKYYGYTKQGDLTTYIFQNQKNGKAFYVSFSDKTKKLNFYDKNAVKY